MSLTWFNLYDASSLEQEVFSGISENKENHLTCVYREKVERLLFYMKLTHNTGLV